MQAISHAADSADREHATAQKQESAGLTKAGKEFLPVTGVWQSNQETCDVEICLLCQE
jgi:hypothetical protein